MTCKSCQAASNNEFDDLSSVSYTHLDVYKRQLFEQSLGEMSFALNLLDSIQTSISLNENLAKLTFIYNFIAILHQRLNDPDNALQFLHQVKDLAPTESHVIRCCITMSGISLLSNNDLKIENSISLLTTELNTLTKLKSTKDAYYSITSNEEFMLRYMPVSYTHLDVYKRQLLDGSTNDELVTIIDKKKQKNNDQLNTNILLPKDKLQ